MKLLLAPKPLPAIRIVIAMMTVSAAFMLYLAALNFLTHGDLSNRMGLALVGAGQVACAAFLAVLYVRRTRRLARHSAGLPRL